MKNILFLFLLFAACTATEEALQSNSNSHFPEQKGVVNDFEDILTENEEEELRKMIAEHEAETTNEFAVVTVASYEPYDTLKNFATDLGNKWGIGKADKDNGMIIVVSKAQREVWVGTGTGMEERLPDKKVQQVIDKYMIPQFKNDNYFFGIKRGLTALMVQLTKEKQQQNESKPISIPRTPETK